MGMRKMLLAVVLAGCGGGLERPPINNFGDVCQQFAEAVCERATACGLHHDGQTESGCKSDVVQACCTADETCQVQPAASDAEVYECLDDVDAMSCADLGADNYPTSCLVI
jgi:hypothetical protein